MALLVGVTLAGGGVGSYLALDIAAAVISLTLIALLRRWPVQVAVLLSVLAAVSPVATPPATLAALVVARWRRLPVALCVAGTGIAAHLIRGAWQPVNGLPYGWYAVLVCVAYAALVGWGTLIRSHHALISSLRDRAERAEADQARRVAEARAAERARIAREMHDVLAHRLSLLATYAGALAYRPDAPPGQLSRAAEVIRSGAHQALDELCEVIGVLRDDELPGPADGPADALRPLPGVADLPRLVEESQAAGMRIEAGGGAWPDDEASSPGEPGSTPSSGKPPLRRFRACLPPPDAYRITGCGAGVGLTNSPQARARAPRRRSPPSTAVLARAWNVTVVEAAWRTGPRRAGAGAGVPGSGTGLIGLSERLELAGGKLESGARSGASSSLHALAAVAGT